MARIECDWGYQAERAGTGLSEAREAGMSPHPTGGKSALARWRVYVMIMWAVGHMRVVIYKHPHCVTAQYVRPPEKNTSRHTNAMIAVS